VLIADATQTVFCDSSGIGALVRAYHQAAATGAQLRMVITTTPVHRIFNLIGADQVLPVYPSLADAQAGSLADPASTDASNGTGRP
jgi:anti-anti-sigma factor